MIEDAGLLCVVVPVKVGENGGETSGSVGARIPLVSSMPPLLSIIATLSTSVSCSISSINRGGCFSCYCSRVSMELSITSSKMLVLIISRAPKS